jgi:hypothetical protein
MGTRSHAPELGRMTPASPLLPGAGELLAAGANEGLARGFGLKPRIAAEVAITELKELMLGGGQPDVMKESFALANALTDEVEIFFHFRDPRPLPQMGRRGLLIER